MSNYELRIKGYCRSDLKINEGGTVASFNMPMDFPKKDKEGKFIMDEKGFKVKDTYWVRCVLFKGLIYEAQERIKNGYHVELLGDMKPTHYQNEKNQQHIIGIELIVKCILSAYPPKEKDKNIQQPVQAEMPINPVNNDFPDDDVPF